MILSLSIPALYQKPQWNCITSPAYPVYCSSLNRVGLFRCCFRVGKYCFVRFSKRTCGREVYAVGKYEGLWEDPDDSEYQDDSENESEGMTESNSDSGLGLEGNEYDKDVVSISNAKELPMENYDKDVAREIEQMLFSEELKILEQNRVLNLEKLSTVKWKPLHSYALSGQIKFMDELLERGCGIDLVDNDGLTALHFSVIGKREAVTSHLLRKGANPKSKDRDGATPLHYAVNVGAMQTVKLLIKYKVDVNAADNEGWTPLHVAVQTRNLDITKILLVNGADRTRRTKDGNAAMDLCLCYGRDFKSYNLAMLLKQVPVHGNI